MRWKRGIKVAIAALASIAVLATALIGFAHTKPGRPILKWLGMNRYTSAITPGSCPLGYDKKATPEQKEAGRREFAATHAGAELATARPALGFELDRTPRADVMQWARENGVACAEPKTGHDLECRDVGAAMLPASFGGVGLRSLWVDFGARGELVSVTTVRKDSDVERVTAVFASVTGAVERASGGASRVEGEPSARFVASGLLKQATAEIRMRDYYALARETNMGDGYLVTEEYRSLPR